MNLFLSGFVTYKKRTCGSGGQSILTIYGLLAPLLTPEKKYPPISARDYLQQRIQANFDAVGKSSG